MKPSPLYLVTLTDLATHTLVVAADSPKEAENVARTALFEETRFPDGLKTLTRETSASAELAPDQPQRTFRIDGLFKQHFSLDVVAASRQEAEQHARRLYAEHCGPFEFETGDSSATFSAYERSVS